MTMIEDIDLEEGIPNEGITKRGELLQKEEENAAILKRQRLAKVFGYVFVFVFFGSGIGAVVGVYSGWVDHPLSVVVDKNDDRDYTLSSRRLGADDGVTSWLEGVQRWGMEMKQAWSETPMTGRQRWLFEKIEAPLMDFALGEENVRRSLGVVVEETSWLKQVQSYGQEMKRALSETSMSDHERWIFDNVEAPMMDFFFEGSTQVRRLFDDITTPMTRRQKWFFENVEAPFMDLMQRGTQLRKLASESLDHYFDEESEERRKLSTTSRLDVTSTFLEEVEHRGKGLKEAMSAAPMNKRQRWFHENVESPMMDLFFQGSQSSRRALSLGQNYAEYLDEYHNYGMEVKRAISETSMSTRERWFFDNVEAPLMDMFFEENVQLRRMLSNDDSPVSTRQKWMLDHVEVPMLDFFQRSVQVRKLFEGKLSELLGSRMDDGDLVDDERNLSEREDREEGDGDFVGDLGGRERNLSEREEREKDDGDFVGDLGGRERNLSERDDREKGADGDFVGDFGKGRGRVLSFKDAAFEIKGLKLGSRRLSTKTNPPNGQYVPMNVASSMQAHHPTTPLAEKHRDRGNPRGSVQASTNLVMNGMLGNMPNGPDPFEPLPDHHVELVVGNEHITIVEDQSEDNPLFNLTQEQLARLPARFVAHIREEKEKAEFEARRNMPNPTPYRPDQPELANMGAGAYYSDAGELSKPEPEKVAAHTRGDSGHSVHNMNDEEGRRRRK